MSWLMYAFHYKLVEKKFDANLFFSNTGSLTYDL